MIKILLVEDDPLLARMYSKIFTMHGFEYVEAVDGQSGIDAAKKYKPDIILLDIMMPQMNGIEALEVLKKDPTFKKTPIVMMTNVEDEATEKLAMELGAAGYLVKSRNDPDETIAYVNKILKSDPVS